MSATYFMAHIVTQSRPAPPRVLALVLLRNEISHSETTRFRCVCVQLCKYVNSERIAPPFLVARFEPFQSVARTHVPFSLVAATARRLAPNATMQQLQPGFNTERSYDRFSLSSAFLTKTAVLNGVWYDDPIFAEFRKLV